jgi:Protein of unknown function (DUF1553)/Protein of unknown function (DUF1549)/Planctomycete cytochrome C
MVRKSFNGRWAARLLAYKNVVFLLFVSSTVGVRATAADVDFTHDVQPILVAKCQKCHGTDKQKGGLRFDTRDGLLAKGDSGAVSVVPGQPGKSELLRRVSAKDALERMPPNGAPLTVAEIETLRRWIDTGATGPKAGGLPSNVAKTELVVTDEDRRHWSYKPLTKVEPPAIKDGAWGRAPIDRFVFAGLRAKKLSPTPPAAARVLIRRVTFDLTGLPPTPDEVEAFVNAKDPDAAYEALVDRLLASPHYGERWGRHWLDVARYADSGGYEGDHDRPTVYHYRDFVIRALNEDMPFDEFVRRQLAGDEIAPDDPLAIAATGFLAAGPGEVYPERLLEEERLRLRYNELDDMVSTTGAALLGLTVGCARCHDHKFDPIPTRDYYRLLAGLHSGDRAEVPLGTRAGIEQAARARAEWDKKRKPVEDDLKKWLAEQRTSLEPRLRAAKIDRLPITDAEKTLLREKPNAPEVKALAKKHERTITVTDDEVRKTADGAVRRRGDELAQRLENLKKEEPKAVPTALAFKDLGPKPVKSWLFRRGDFHDRTIPVEVGFLSVLTRGKQPTDFWQEAKASGDRTDTTYQRRAIADWVADADRGAGPLLARVIVNRIWQHHFGEGLVRTPNDFGVRGDRPTHPELLEWLANDLVTHGWKLKRVHRMILLSTVYRQASTFDPEKAKLDPDNRFLWRMRPQRLEAEVLRDSLLAVGGTLNPEMYGPAFKAPIPTDAMVARNVKNPYPTDIPDTAAVRRRSVYMFHKRVVPYPLLQAFDAPDAQQCSGQRANTTVVPQALALLNDPFVRARAAEFAARLVKESGEDPTKCVERAYRLAFSRTPTPVEQTAGIEFLKAQERDRSSRQPKAAPTEIRRLALTDYCQVLFGLNEFLYVD